MNDIQVDGDVAYVALNRGCVAVIDAADIPLLTGTTWFAHEGAKTIYVRRQESHDGRLVNVYLHRLLMGYPEGFTVDHCDLDGLNNRRSNLRLASMSQNAMNRRKRSDNSTGFKGVYKAQKGSRWLAKVSANGENFYLGRFATAEEAHEAVLAKRRELHGEFERTL